MKLSEILGWPDKLMKISWPTKHYQDGHNTAIDSCDREIDREALANVIIKWIGYDSEFSMQNSKELSEVIISNMPTWLKTIERK